MRKLTSAFLVLALLLTAFIQAPKEVYASTGDEGINEKFGLPIVVYGEALSEEQKQEVRNLLDIDDPSTVNEIIVTAEDLVNFIGGDPSSNMYSSAKITRKEEGNGLVINIVNQENITQVTNEMYANALLTAGIENAVVEVASPLKVSGHSALTGIYKAYNVDGESLDKDRMEVANEELEVATGLAAKEGMDQEKVSELLTEIKQAIAEQNPASKEEIEQIVQDQLANLNIDLNEEDIARLVALFDKMRSINIDFDNVKSQLDDIASDVRNKLEEVANDEGFWQGVKDFFQKLIDGLKSLFG
ncbi:DUF1002 domain-containing protein [Radiobacillus kanasensis]|uniref:DUF1002 domain-containing protein n=1 Tax=Radiobacillus kanasensis TaxID=2844358 RepID=UPI001E62066E|nr:DUF1002 domain-containing protein [Radiobacillus kanasensis]UFT99113.1 DUF1002 domain-containing protein [Radiobacillus kanasensis]